MPRSHYNWQQFFADAEAARHRRRGRGTEARTGRADRSELVDDVVAWITAYLDRPKEEDEGHSRRGRRGATRRFDFNTLFEDGSDPSVWPDEVHEHLAALRDRLHGISAQHDSRGRSKHARWGRRRRSTRDADPAARHGSSSRARRLMWLAATRVALLVITAMVARGREARSRRRRGFSV
jgi:hypothetical protein